MVWLYDVLIFDNLRDVIINGTRVAFSITETRAFVYRTSTYVDTHTRQFYMQLVVADASGHLDVAAAPTGPA